MIRYLFTELEFKHFYTYSLVIQNIFEFDNHEPFGLDRFATDRCYAPQVKGRYGALLHTLSTM